MFSQKVTETDKFLDMGMTAQSLYFHLGMNADDDGFVGNPKSIKRMIGASEDDLKALVEKDYLIVFEDGVVVIKDWRVSNYVKPDRYTPTIYTDDRKLIGLDKNKRYQFVPNLEPERNQVGTEMEPKRIQSGDKMEPECIQNGSKKNSNFFEENPQSQRGQGINAMEPNWNQNGTEMDPQVRLGKDRLGKDSINNIVDFSESPTQIYESEFEQLWSMYPKKQGKKAALRHYKTWRKRSKDNTFEVMKEKLEHYLKFLKIKQTPLEYTLNGSTWFNGRFDDELDMTPPKPRYSQQPKTVHKATDWSKYQQHSSKPTMTTEERNKIFKEFGR